MKNNKFLAVFLSVVMSLSTLNGFGVNNTSVFAEETGSIEKVMGDFSRDGEVNAYDALLVLYAAAKCIYTPEQQAILNSCDFSLGNVYKDEFLNAVDALYILQYAARIIESLDGLTPPVPTNHPIGYDK